MFSFMKRKNKRPTKLEVGASVAGSLVGGMIGIALTAVVATLVFGEPIVAE